MNADPQPYPQKPQFGAKQQTSEPQGRPKPGVFGRGVLVGRDRGLLEVEVAAVALFGLGLRPRHSLLAHRRLLLHHRLVIALLKGQSHEISNLLTCEKGTYHCTVQYAKKSCVPDSKRYSLYFLFFSKIQRFHS
jgi:hypothetical protein